MLPLRGRPTRPPLKVKSEREICNMSSVGLLVVMSAKPGKEGNLTRFLENALALVEREPATVAWFALRLDPSRFAIFDAFADSGGREAHLAGEVAAALMERAPELLLEAPAVEQADVLGEKQDGRTGVRFQPPGQEGT
jgi:quinol monooxygenase YgiN